MKRCTKCGEEKPPEAFAKDARNKDGLTGACRVCGNLATARWQKNNPDKVLDKVLRWQRANAEKSKAQKRQSRISNAGTNAAIAARRRARERDACPPWADQATIAAVYEEAARLTRETGISHHVDHIIPLAGENVSGLHVPWNLRAIPASENIKKSNKLIAGAEPFTQEGNIE